MEIAVVGVRGLVKRYGPTTVVRGIDFEIRRGECFGLLGPNGAGKTTTIRMLLGLTPPDAGSIRVLGHAIPDDARRMRARVGVVPQHDNLDPDFTVRENLIVYGRYFGVPRTTLESRATKLLDFASLPDRSASPVTTLSGGMRRRLLIARSLIADPEILFLDEPTTGLDPQARHLIWERLRRLRADGKTLILTTHYMEEAERLCDRLLVLDHGTILDGGTPADLVRRHVEEHVVEVSGDDARSWLDRLPAELTRRRELVGETAFCYVDDPEPVLAHLDGSSTLRFVHRRANLEDVFLKLTGREIRE